MVPAQMPPGDLSGSSSSPPAAIRSEMVTTARQFLANPRVRQTPLEEQKAFLRGKGLTEAEIRAAIADVQNEASSSSSSAPLIHHPSSPSVPPVSPRGVVVDLARSALVFGTAGYMVYRFVRSWLLPQLLNVPDPAEERMQRLEEQVGRLGESSRCIADAVAQTLAAVTEQNEQLSRTMMMAHGRGNDTDRLHAELGIVKSLLLSQHQFPPIPEAAKASERGRNSNNLQNGQSNSGSKTGGLIPAWQLEERDGDGEGEEDEKAEEERENGLNTTNGSSV